MKSMDYYVAGAFGFVGFLYGILIHGSWFNWTLVFSTLLLAFASSMIMVENKTIKTIAVAILIVAAGPFVVGMMVGATVDFIHHSSDRQGEFNSQAIQNICNPQYYHTIPYRRRPLSYAELSRNCMSE